jgi:Cft2 family RNA processing exonuclease
MADAKIPSCVLAMAYVDSDRLRAAERALEEWMRDNGYALKHPMASVPRNAMERINDMMTILTSRYSGNKNDIIFQIEQKDETFAREIRHLKHKLQLRDEEIRLKDYELSLKDRELSLAEHEILLLRNEAQFSTM